MANYRNGIETRDALYASAQKNFSAKGYFGASIKDIVTDIDSKLGLFTYYFESKESLALQILYELQFSVQREIERSEHICAIRANLLLADMVRTRVWLELLVTCPHVARFAGEISVTGAYFDHASQDRMDFCRLLGERHPDLATSNEQTDPDGIKLKATLMAGMLTQFCRDLPSLSLAAPLEETVDRFFAWYYGLLIADKSKLREFIQVSRACAEDVHLKADESFFVTYR